MQETIDKEVSELLKQQQECEQAKQYSIHSDKLYLCKKDNYCENQLNFGGVIYCRKYLEGWKKNV